MHSWKICAGGLGLLLNAHCTGAPVGPVGTVAESSRGIAATAPATAPDERLARDRQLVVEFAPPADATHVHAWLLAGELAAEETPDATALVQARQILHGGQDTPRPVVYDDVSAGDYTVCGRVDSATLRCKHVTVTDEATSRVVAMHG